jgi:hypothetical protein
MGRFRSSSVGVENAVQNSEPSETPFWQVEWEDSVPHLLALKMLKQNY